MLKIFRNKIKISAEKFDINNFSFKVACRVQMWKKNHFVKIVTILVTVFLKIALCLQTIITRSYAFFKE